MGSSEQRGVADASSVVESRDRTVMSLAYRLLYAVGYTPWEQVARLSESDLRAVRTREERATYGQALDLGCGTHLGVNWLSAASRSPQPPEGPRRARGGSTGRERLARATDEAGAAGGSALGTSPDSDDRGATEVSATRTRRHARDAATTSAPRAR